MPVARENSVLLNTKKTWKNRRLLISTLLALQLADMARAQVPAPAQAGGRQDKQEMRYRVIHLGPGTIADYPDINASGQVAFSTVTQDGTKAFFFDGRSVRNIGALGNGPVYVADLNDASQVTGTSLNEYGIENAYVWSKRGGMRDIRAQPGRGRSYGLAINNQGVVTGSFNSSARPFRWSAATGVEDLGITAGLREPASGRKINDAGLIAGVGTVDDDGNVHAFAWTRAHGLVDIDTLNSVRSKPEAVGAGNEVAGNRLASLDDGGYRPFMWTRATGMVDLGVGRGSSAWVNAMTPGLHIAGAIGFSDGHQRAMSWTRSGGMRELGTLGGRTSVARDVNAKGQIVGFAENRAGAMRAFVWSAAGGMLDLNRLLRHAPPGLVLDHAMAINDRGDIVASSNAGLVLLKPQGCSCGHTLGPVVAPRLLQAGAPLQASLSFVDGENTGTRAVHWSWGDGSSSVAQQLDERAGSARASHSFSAPGIYAVSATVVDRKDRATTVSQDVVVTPATGGAVAGAGVLLSPPGALKQAPNQTAQARFALIAPLAAQAGAGTIPAMLRVDLPGMDLRSRDLRLLGRQGGHYVFEGSATLKGADNYRFRLATSATAQGGDPGRFLLKVWRADAAGKNDVLVYDNASAASDAGRLIEGGIVDR